MEKRHEEFQIKVPIAQVNDIVTREEEEKNLYVFGTGRHFMRVHFPKDCLDAKTLEDPMQVLLPVGQKFKTEDEVIQGQKYKVYTLPAASQVRTAAVSRWSLAMVIALAVAIICVWGTLVGSMLPLIFRRFGVDPGIASSPFVATFVDVTGIVIYFSIASIYLL